MIKRKHLTLVHSVKVNYAELIARFSSESHSWSVAAMNAHTEEYKQECMIESKKCEKRLERYRQLASNQE